MSSITLKYWDGRGLMEPNRIMLKIAAKAFTDERISDPSTAGDLSANLGRVPIAVIDGVAIGQSVAINYAVASVAGMMGAGPIEAAQILSIAEHIKELTTAFRKVVPWGKEPSAEDKVKFFDDATASDVEGPADGKTRDARMLLWHLGRIEKTVGEGGFAVGGRLSLADVLLYCALGDTLAEDRAKTPLAPWQREPFSDAARTAAALAKFPRIAACVAAVAAHPAVVAHSAERVCAF